MEDFFREILIATIQPVARFTRPTSFTYWPYLASAFCLAVCIYLKINWTIKKISLNETID